MSTHSTVRLVLFERDRMLRELLVSEASRSGLEVLRACDEPRDFLAPRPLEHPDVAIADLRAPSGQVAEAGAAVELQRGFRDQHPNVPLVVMGGSGPPDAETCYREGAAAWVDVSSSAPRDLIQTVREVMGGTRVFPFSMAPSGMHPEPAQRTSTFVDQLSMRERQVLTYIGGGADNLKIAAHLGISERTVKSHVTNLYRKTQLENRTQLALLARELGLRLPLDRPVLAGAETSAAPVT